MKIKSYEDAVDYLESLIGKIIFQTDPKTDPLKRMRVLLSLLGNPQEKFRSIIVGGTSGKGSTAYLISHILKTAGYKTGFTLSPHLQRINERLQINGKEISDLKFTKMVTSMIRIIETMKKMPVGAPSYFEVLIGMAFTYFAKEKVDIVVVEVGMGGEFDATNTLNPLIAVLTNVGLDHTNVLGKTVEKIAKTKAGIIKFARGPVAPSSRPMSSVASSLRALDGTPSSRSTPRLTVVSGVRQAAVVKIVEERCRGVGAKLFRLGKDFDYRIKKESPEGSVFDLTITHDRGQLLNDLQLSLIGKYQVENASLAIETVLELEKFSCLPAGRGFKIPEKAIRKALKTAFFPGRFEIIARGPAPTFPPASAPSADAQMRAVGIPSSRVTPRSKNSQLSTLNSQLVLDGAHNPTKMKAFLATLKKLFPKERKVFVIAFKNDKDIPKMLTQITKIADEIIITEFNRATDMSISASADAESIKDELLRMNYKNKIIIEKDSAKALNKALSIQQFNNLTIIVVTGSLYLVGEIRNML